jgi:aryl-alcohol dehydrogenase-like predicted oxidoreductase
MAGRQPPPDSRAASQDMNRFMETAGRHYRSDYLLEAVARLKPVAAEFGLTMAQMALAWVLRRKEVTSAIIGASRPEQIIENIKSVGVNFPADVIDLINRTVSDVAVWT